MASNSTITIQDLVDDAKTMGDLAPAIAAGGFSNAPALSIANDVIAAMLLGGPQGQPFNWKWNRVNITPFPTISWQQDYFVPNLVNLGWLEYSWASNINQTTIPKESHDMEVRRDLEVTRIQTGYPDKICWMQNDTLQTGTWGQTPLGPTFGNTGGSQALGAGAGGLQNPGPNVIITNPIGQVNAPVNPTTCITDPNGNLWTVTTYGTCGTTEPTWPTTPTYPSYADQTISASTVTDGSVIWTAINPKGQGFRLNPIPPQTGVTWLVQAVGQMRVPIFKNLRQTLDPVPDDYATYFKQGFFAQCYRRNPDQKVRNRFAQEWQIWLDGLNRAVMSGQREMDDYGFYPSSSIMDSGMGIYVGPAYPWPNAWGN